MGYWMRSRFRFRTVCCPLVGLLVVLAFVGHDLAMAGDAHQTVESGHHGDGLATVGHRMSVEHVSRTSQSEQRMDAASNTARDGCGYDRVAVFTGDDNATASLHGHASSALSEYLYPAPTQQFPTVDEPTAPPGVRRALLQVFLI